MPKFRVNPWLQLNNIGFPLIATLWLLYGFSVLYKVFFQKPYKNVVGFSYLRNF